MKKGFFYSIFVIFILIFSSVTARGTIGQGYNVMTNPGEDMRTEMNISWHSDDKISFVQYTKASDTDWKDARLVLGMSEEFSVPESQQFGSKTVISDGFTPRYHLKVNLTGLEPDTEYKYRVGRDPSFSDTYYFKTGSGVEPFSFLAFTDPQYANDSGASIFNNLVQKALEIDPDIRFSVVSGDLVDRGGKIEQWNILFRQSSLRLMPFAVAPGNHEYYDASPTPVFFDNTPGITSITTRHQPPFSSITPIIKVFSIIPKTAPKAFWGPVIILSITTSCLSRLTARRLLTAPQTKPRKRRGLRT